MPPNGWDVPGRAEEAHAELDAFVRLLAGLRDVLPPELRAQLADLARQLLLLVRALVETWIARLDARDGRGAAAPAPAAEPVEDIPIS